jgi:hypothetical protein
MKKIVKNFYFSFPIQLLLLHFRKYQIVLLFWLILFATVSGGFLKNFGAIALYLTPEYMGQVNALSAALVGMSLGVFIMSWNITTFILHSKYFKFLAATHYPFLKYCLNNAIIPIAFIIFYLYKMIPFANNRELLSAFEIFVLVAGFLSGIVLLVLISLLYFFGADRRIIRNRNAIKIDDEDDDAEETSTYWFKVQWYMSKPFEFKKPRPINHYDPILINSVFNRHHITGMILIFVAFLILLLLGFIMDNPFFQLPAAASITLLFATLIAFLGGASYFLQSWSVPAIIGVVIILNILYKLEIIDPTNRAYGINYKNKTEWPDYNKATVEAVCNTENKKADVANLLKILNNWKAKQKIDKPKLVIINCSGGGLRSANFTAQVMHQLETSLPNGLLHKTGFITGASGGMLGATYMRELYWQSKIEKKKPNIGNQASENISKDLLNALFSSFVVRDIAAPAQKFTYNNQEYVKDRGYAFEEKLNENAGGILDKQFKDYQKAESTATIPLIIFSGTIARDNRRLILSTQPLSFAMQPWQHDSLNYFVPPDGLDYQRFFSKQDPQSLRLLSALRINATFPYILPNVWLPTHPVIDVMDAGLRDNYGQDVTLRTLQYCKDWINENTSGVVIVQIRDRENDGDWNYPFENQNFTELLSRPFVQMQYNMIKVQQFQQNNEYNYFKQYSGVPVELVTYQYTPMVSTNRASLSFHLTPSEKRDITQSLQNEWNTAAFNKAKQLLNY